MAQDAASADDSLSVHTEAVTEDQRAQLAADLKAARQRVTDAQKALAALEKHPELSDKPLGKGMERKGRA